MGKGNEIDRIISRSDEIRAEEQKRKDSAATRDGASAKKNRPIGALRIWFVNYNTPLFFIGIPMMIILALFLVSTGYSDEKTRVISLALGAVAGAMALYLAVYFLRTFPIVRRAWRYRPEYPVRGVDGLFAATDRAFWRNDAEQWFDCAVTVKLAEETPEAAKAFSAALTIFAAEANAAYYGAAGSDTTRDPRKDWTRSGLCVSGSADGRVLFRLKKFLSGELAVVARHYRDVLVEVEISRSGAGYIVSRMGYSGDGTAS